VHGHLGGLPPVPDLDHERRLGRVLVTAARRRLLRSAHDLADGGLAQALAESCLRRGRAATVQLPEGDPCVQLFSETPGRVLVSLPAGRAWELTALCEEHGIAAGRIGTVTGTEHLEVAGFSVPLADLRNAWQAPIPAAMQAAH
jgi:phosphoribosylformylglycinamidine synthase